jgi:hypothetical protein
MVSSLACGALRPARTADLRTAREVARKEIAMFRHLVRASFFVSAPATSPCRSITRAIARAVDGDHIVGGPGVYGDIDHDGQSITPGDEVAPADCDCAIFIDKAVSGPDSVVSVTGVSVGLMVRSRNGLVADNHVVDTGDVGVFVLQDDVTVRHNVFAGNRGAAIRIGQLGVDAVGTVITSNDFLNNGTDSFNSPGCAVIAATLQPVSAEQNFWGGARGPGVLPTDHADRNCSPGVVDATPFLTRPVTISNLAGR